MIREIEIWRVAILMVNRYADEAEANSFQRAEELRPKGESRRSAPKLAADGDHAGELLGVGSLSRLNSLPTRRDHRTDNAPIWRGRTHMTATEHRQGTVRFRMLGWAKGAAETAALNCEEWMD